MCVCILSRRIAAARRRLLSLKMKLLYLNYLLSAAAGETKRPPAPHSLCCCVNKAPFNLARIIRWTQRRVRSRKFSRAMEIYTVLNSSLFSRRPCLWNLFRSGLRKKVSNTWGAGKFLANLTRARRVERKGKRFTQFIVTGESGLLII